ncbi:DUF397 domain-containing protein [Streptomyces sp. NPDC026672]|uniref:DUF397 domain-containing protein n=1 Tax=unclassified Streptomyces TaxID=2593676 RepID=UPI003404CBBA
MSHVRNADAELGSDQWHKPWSGSNGGNCVEAKQLGDGQVALRQSADPEGPALIFPAREISALIAAAKDGTADFLLA